jgi:predicted type IV restriction endonuclease
MELNEKMYEFAKRIEPLKGSITTEEATKTSMIMPFFQMLGYDVFNPLEFVPEFTADVGIKKGEKVDYAIVIDGEPLILIECKPCNKSLDKHASQLFRYFGTTNAKFAILTNGLTYQFFTDLESKNKMDMRPFLTIDLLKLKDRDIIEVAKFQKSVLDVDNILNSAENLKYSRLIKDYFAKEIESPSPEFVKFILNYVYDGVKTQKVIDEFTPIVKRAITQYISDSMNTKIKAALNNQDDSEGNDSVETNSKESDSESKDSSKKERRIVTTIEELESYAIIKSILRTIVDSDRIVYRDTESYLGILLDDNNRKWICRVYLMSSVKYLTIADENKNGIRHDINDIDDIYKYSVELKDACSRYL